MRHFFAVLSLIALAACSGERSYQSPTLEALKTYFSANANSEISLDFVREVPRLEALLSTNLTESAARGLHIDFVLMIHEQYGVDVSDLVALSQEQVMYALEQLNPEITAAEDSFSDHLSLEQIVADKYMLERDILGEDPSHTTEDDLLLLDGVVEYIKLRPDAWVMGGEDRHLITFSVLAGLVWLYTGDEEFVTLFDHTNALRSEVVVAKLIDTLRKSGKTRGAVVFGGGHEHDFRQIAESFGLSATYYCAAKTVPLSALTLEGLRC